LNRSGCVLAANAFHNLLDEFSISG
jgi:hypothetical protein